MKKLCALLCVLVLLGACASPALVNDEPTTEQATTTEPPTTAAPTREWPGVPQAYWAILENSAPREDWEPLFPPSILRFYALADINNDGVPELIMAHMWVSSDVEPVISRIYTLDGDEPVFLEGFNPVRSRGHIADDGTIYGARYHHGHWWLWSSVLNPHATELTQLSAWSAENLAWDFYQEEPWYVEPDFIYFRGINEVHRQQITAEEFYAATPGYDPPPNPMQFEFIPLG
ncbi:MAG: hypothetical protein FWB76_00995 [Oscillospiraceae bacterium]|nr:hypothetical protein [Oscillospiraceae bacterium]